MLALVVQEKLWLNNGFWCAIVLYVYLGLNYVSSGPRRWV